MRLAALCALLLLALPGAAEHRYTPAERSMKVMFLYNFMQFTEWPVEVGPRLNLCLYGPHQFERSLHALQGEVVNARRIALQHRRKGDPLHDCQLLFVGELQGAPELWRVLATLQHLPVLTVADSPNAALQGFALNMHVSHDKISFEANLRAARAAGLHLSVKLLRLAEVVIQ